MNTTTLIIKDLNISMYIGVGDAEHESPQNVRINILMDVANYTDWKSDNIDDVVCYASIIETIKTISQSRHFKLVETLAEVIAQDCLKDNRIRSIRVKIEKTDIFDDTDSVGVEIARDR